MLDVLAPGLLTLVQDLGRPGQRRYGIPLGGAADRDALRIGNLLVGNAENAAALEYTLIGPRLVFRDERLVALTGALGDASCEGRAVPYWRPFRVRPGAELRLGRLTQGARGYLAVSGGIDVPLVLGSRATELRAGFGGYKGRALAQGDRIALLRAPEPTRRALAGRDPKHHDAIVVAPWWVAPTIDYRGDTLMLHVLDGADARALDRASIRTATGTHWNVSAASDRMGVRFEGVSMRLDAPREKISSAVMPGAVQLPPDGRPIVLGVDAQTTGGYPCIAHVMRADLSLLMQLRPGDQVMPIRVTAAAADAAWAAQRRGLARLREALAAHWTRA
jgi:antagonist of KipI